MTKQEQDQYREYLKNKKTPKRKKPRFDYSKFVDDEVKKERGE